LLDEPLSPQHVRVPGVLVDRIVVAEERDHEQTFAEADNATYYRARPIGTPPPRPAPLPRDERAIIAARRLRRTSGGAIANLGIGMPEGIARVACERGILDDCTLTVESGPIGGMPAAGLSFGASVYPRAVIDQPRSSTSTTAGGSTSRPLDSHRLTRRGT
jgi:propionate CoA-transferase